jgi:hypothetical protein
MVFAAKNSPKFMQKPCFLINTYLPHQASQAYQASQPYNLVSKLLKQIIKFGLNDCKFGLIALLNTQRPDCLATSLHQRMHFLAIYALTNIYSQNGLVLSATVIL